MSHHALRQFLSLPVRSFDFGSSRISSSAAMRSKKEAALHPL
jgi:hypothetical protein